MTEPMTAEKIIHDIITAVYRNGKNDQQKIEEIEKILKSYLL